MIKTKTERSILEALGAEAAANGVDVVDAEVVGTAKAPCVRVRMEAADGSALSLDDVAAKTHWVGEVLDRLDPFSGSYTMEVSSPGLDRPLTRERDFERFAGSTASVVTNGTGPHRKFKGVVVGAHDGTAVFQVDGEQVEVALDDMKKCKLEPVFDFSGSDKKGK